MKKLISIALVTTFIGGCATAPPAPVVPFPSHEQWILLYDLPYRPGISNTPITVPAGFVTDYASIPKPLWSFASPHGSYSEAAIVHDYLYWTQSCSRLQADNIFLIAMKEANVGAFKRWAIYRAVRGAGENSWNANTRDFNAGLPRSVPEEQRRLSENSDWYAMQKTLATSGYHDVSVPKNLPYCALGDTTDVPSEISAVSSAQ